MGLTHSSCGKVVLACERLSSYYGFNEINLNKMTLATCCLVAVCCRCQTDVVDVFWPARVYSIKTVLLEYDAMQRTQRLNISFAQTARPNWFPVPDAVTEAVMRRAKDVMCTQSKCGCSRVLFLTTFKVDLNPGVLDVLKRETPGFMSTSGLVETWKP